MKKRLKDMRKADLVELVKLQQEQLARYRTRDNEVELAKMIINRFTLRDERDEYRK